MYSYLVMCASDHSIWVRVVCSLFKFFSLRFIFLAGLCVVHMYEEQEYLSSYLSVYLSIYLSI